MNILTSLLSNEEMSDIKMIRMCTQLGVVKNEFIFLLSFEEIAGLNFVIMDRKEMDFSLYLRNLPKHNKIKEHV